MYLTPLPSAGVDTSSSPHSEVGGVGDGALEFGCVREEGLGGCLGSATCR